MKTAFDIGYIFNCLQLKGQARNHRFTPRI